MGEIQTLQKSPEPHPRSQITCRMSKDKKFYSIHLLAIRSPNPAKYTLALMDALVSDEEMSTKCYIMGSKKGTKSFPMEKKRISV